MYKNEEFQEVVKTKLYNSQYKKICLSLLGNTKWYDIYLVWWKIRDILLWVWSKDYDFCWNMPAEMFARYFWHTNSLSDVKKYKSVKTKIHNTEIEYTQFRKEIYDKNHNLLEVKVTDDIEEDSLRRDFSINSFYFNIKTEDLYNFNGWYEDIINRQINFIWNKKERILQDPIRLLRMLNLMCKLDNYDNIWLFNEYINELNYVNYNIWFQYLMWLLYKYGNKEVFNGDYLGTIFFNWINKWFNIYEMHKYIYWYIDLLEKYNIPEINIFNRKIYNILCYTYLERLYKKNCISFINKSVLRYWDNLNFKQNIELSKKNIVEYLEYFQSIDLSKDKERIIYDIFNKCNINTYLLMLFLYSISNKHNIKKITRLYNYISDDTKKYKIKSDINISRTEIDELVKKNINVNEYFFEKYIKE